MSAKVNLAAPIGSDGFHGHRPAVFHGWYDFSLYGDKG